MKERYERKEEIITKARTLHERMGQINKKGLVHTVSF